MLWVLAVIIGVFVACFLCRYESDFITLPVCIFFIGFFILLTMCAYGKVSDKYLVTEKVQVSQYDVISFNDEDDTFKYVKDGTIYVDTTDGKEIIEKDNVKPTITEYEIRKEFKNHKKLIEFLFFFSGPPASNTETITLPTGTIKKINSN